MTKTIRAHQVQVAAEKLFGPKLAKLNKKIDGLVSRVSLLERSEGAVPIEAEVVGEGAVLKKK